MSGADIRRIADCETFILSGNISTLYVADGALNLLKGIQSKMLASGMAAAVSGMASSVATATMVEMYGGENVQHFGCHVGNRMVIGTFQEIGFNEGDEVKVVATAIDQQTSFAHAVVRPSDGLLWMPLAITKGRWKLVQWLCKAGLVVLAVAALMAEIAHAMWKEIDLATVSMILLVQLAVCAFVGGGTFWSSLEDAKYAEAIMWRLGFKNPRSVNLSPFSISRLKSGSSYVTYDLRKALKFYGKRDPL